LRCTHSPSPSPRFLSAPTLRRRRGGFSGLSSRLRSRLSCECGRGRGGSGVADPDQVPVLINWHPGLVRKVQGAFMKDKPRPVTSSLGRQGGRRVFWEGPKFLKPSPIVLNYVQHNFPGGVKKCSGGFRPACSPLVAGLDKTRNVGNGCTFQMLFYQNNGKHKFTFIKA